MFERRSNSKLYVYIGTMSHIRINMGPDGGIARCRVYGEVTVDIDKIKHSLVNTHEQSIYNTTLYDTHTHTIDLLAVEMGGISLACSNKHYGHPRNLMNPGRGTCMGDGWETARQPKRPAYYIQDSQGLMMLPGCDWCILKLGLPGVISKIIVDTNYYAGNFPESFKLEGCNVYDNTSGSNLSSTAVVTDDAFRIIANQTIQDIQNCTDEAEVVKIECPTPPGVKDWVPIINRSPLKASRIHTYTSLEINVCYVCFIMLYYVTYLYKCTGCE